ncbi:MAG: ABC transporter ATP-binding protein [Chitinophagaceae bacterium]
MSIAIKVEGLSKVYQLGEFSSGTLSRDIEQWYFRLRGKEDRYQKIGETINRSPNRKNELVWSLKNINLEILQGEAVGIIGSNGAGKSTLLKILSRVTSPTKGSAKIKGRIASLLEVGTGFHPELTGRENVFLNGAIIGMRREGIKKNFDAIVDFAGVEQYIDTPVKRYSSGMYVRLAFAVAAHLESEILIVDEVLSIGDYEFQKKCLGIMGEVSKEKGKTVLFVSHNMATIQALCTKGIVLNKGNTLFEGSVSLAIQEYTRLHSKNGSLDYNGRGFIKRISIENINNTIKYHSELSILIEFRSEILIKNLVVGIVIKDRLDVSIVGINNRHYINNKLHERDIYKGVMKVTFKPLTILPGLYKLDVYFGDSTEDLESVHDAISFEVEESIINTTTHPLDLSINKVFMSDISWELDHE